MKSISFAARFALVLSCALMATAPAAAQFWQCAPYAREISGIQIRGNANTWWGQAEGRYQRGHTPQIGAVLAFEATHRMRVGHVATVSRIVSDREVLLTHANWSRRGQIETNVRAIDVSAAGDWSLVKVWYAPQGGLGTSSYPTRGFIYSGSAPANARGPFTIAPHADPLPPVTLAGGMDDSRGLRTLVAATRF